MGFIRGVITGVAVAAGVAAWYMSRSGQQVREQYKFEQRLGELGDQLQARTAEIQSTVNTQLAEMRAKGQADGDVASSNGHSASDTLDAASASAAEAAADVAAEADAMTTPIKQTATDVVEGSTDS